MTNDLKPAWWNGSPENDWTEDFSHENGNYWNKCMICEEDFVGHKRRFVCKKCKTKDNIRWKAMSEEERQAELKKLAEDVEAWLESKPN